VGVALRERLSRLYELEDTPGRIASMEGVRGLAVLLVFGVHVHSLFGVELAHDSVLFRVSQLAGVMGNAGVDLFFALSGYLIYGKLIRKPAGYGAFVARRVRRIYPAFLAVLAIYLALHFTWFPLPQFPRGPAAGLYLLQNIALLPGLFEIPPVFAVAWSLSYEMFFYATIPLLIWITGMRRWTPALRALFFLLWTAAYLGLNMRWPAWTIAAIALAPFAHVRMILFVAGILVKEIQSAGIRGNRWSEGAAMVLIGLCCAGYVALGWNPWLAANLRTAPAKAVMLSIGFAPCLFHCFAYQGILNSLFSWTPLRWMGNMSYSYYLLHGLSLNGLNLVFRHWMPAAVLTQGMFLGLVCMGLAVTVVVSSVLFAWVEKPLSLRTRRASFIS